MNVWLECWECKSDDGIIFERLSGSQDRGPWLVKEGGGNPS